MMNPVSFPEALSLTCEVLFKVLGNFAWCVPLMIAAYAGVQLWEYWMAPVKKETSKVSREDRLWQIRLDQAQHRIARRH